MAAVLADKVVLNEVTSEFVDDFIQVIHDMFHSSLSATDTKAVLVHAWSKKLRPLLGNKSWMKFIEIHFPKETIWPQLYKRWIALSTG